MALLTGEERVLTAVVTPHYKGFQKNTQVQQGTKWQGIHDNFRMVLRVNIEGN